MYFLLSFDYQDQYFVRSLHNQFDRQFANSLPCSFEIECNEGYLFYQTGLLTLASSDSLSIGNNEFHQNFESSGKL